MNMTDTSRSNHSLSSNELAATTNSQNNSRQRVLSSGPASHHRRPLKRNHPSVEEWYSLIDDDSKCILCLEDSFSEDPDEEPFQCSNCELRNCYKCCHTWLKGIILNNDDIPLACVACHVQIPEAEVEYFLGTLLFKKYKYFSSKRKHRNDPTAIWCPREGCFKLLSNQENPLPSESQYVACSHCGAQVCVSCGHERSETLRCICYLQKRTNFLTLIWKLMYTKECPSCRSPIQRDGGCPRVHCPSCKADFCWNCKRILGGSGRLTEYHYCSGNRHFRRACKVVKIITAFLLFLVCAGTLPTWGLLAYLLYATRNAEQRRHFRGKVYRIWNDEVTRFRQGDTFV